MTDGNEAERHRPGNHRPQTHHDSAEVIAKIDALLDGNETQHSPEWAMPIRSPHEPTVEAATFTTVPNLHQVIAYAVPGDPHWDALTSPTSRRATEQLTFAVQYLGRLLWSRVERLAGPIVDWISLHIPTRRPTK